MTKFFKNLYRLLIINTPFFIILNYISNFLPNYKTKRKSGEIELKIYKNFKSFDETEKWFCNNLYYLSSNLKLLNNINNILEIGSYEGRSALFFLKYFLNSKITCVDTWSGSDEHNLKDFKFIEKNFDLNTSYHQNNNRLIKHKINSNFFFQTNKDYFDLIYIDGDHSSDQVLLDINNAWKILNNGGCLILDDYLWWYYSDLKKNPSTPINSFIIKNYSSISKLIIWHQVIIIKNVKS